MNRRITTVAGVAVAAMIFSALVSLPALAEEAEQCKAELEACVKEMVDNLRQRGWVGIELDTETEGGILVTRVVPSSPAEAAGLMKGDLLVAMNGVPYTREKYVELLKKMYSAMTPGGQVTYDVRRSGNTSEITVTLGRVPEEVIEKWVGYHVLHQHQQQAEKDQATDREEDG